jgi:hypothetical protein
MLHLMEKLMDNEQQDIAIKGVRRREERLTSREELERVKNEYVYWWYRTLKESSAYRECCRMGGVGELDETYQKFGDIFREYDTFDKWWFNRGRYLLQIKTPTPKVKLINDFGTFRRSSDDKNFLILAIPLTITKASAMRGISKFLNEAHQILYKEKTINIYEAADISLKYQKSKIRNETIELLLKIYRYRKRKPKAKLLELANLIEFEPDIFLRTTTDIEYITPEYEKMIIDRRKTIAASRYIKQAENLIYNAERGIFPSIKKIK